MKGVRIATVYRDDPYDELPTVNMAFIRWLRLSQQFAALGATSDIIVNHRCGEVGLGSGIRMVPFSRVRWDEYDVVKTLYQRGFDTLERHGGADHPFIVSSLATVVGCEDGRPGVQVVPEDRGGLWRIQQKIAARSRLVSVRTPGNKDLWNTEFPAREPPLLVPTGVDEIIPEARANPYRGIDGPVALYTGNLARTVPGQLNARWADRLERVGRLLRARGIVLCFVGPRANIRLDPAAVLDLGAVTNDAIWDYTRFAAVGIALAEGPTQLNESSKLYYYLRAGLPVVSEDPIPNNDLLETSGLGIRVAYDDAVEMAEAVEAAVYTDWPRAAGIALVLEKHTWKHRARSYRELFPGTGDTAHLP